MEKEVKASVVMSAYNSEKYIAEAIESVLSQTFSEYEFIIIDDGSTDGTLDIIKSYSDDRIHLIRNKTNLGLTKSLNRGLTLAKGKYIIRTDADDINLPHRFEVQISFMENNPDVMLSSCGMMVFGIHREKSALRINEKQIRARLVFNTVLFHPCFIFRKDIFDRGLKYNPQYKYAQDYDFQVRVSRKYHIACIPDVLVYYRTSKEQIGIAKSEEQQLYAAKIRKKQFRFYGVTISETTANCIGRVMKSDEMLPISQLLVAIVALCKLHIAIWIRNVNERNEIDIIIKQYLKVMWKEMCLRFENNKKGVAIWKK